MCMACFLCVICLSVGKNPHTHAMADHLKASDVIARLEEFAKT